MMAGDTTNLDPYRPRSSGLGGPNTDRKQTSDLALKRESDNGEDLYNPVGKSPLKDVPKDDDAAIAVWISAILLCVVVLLWVFAETTTGPDALLETDCQDNVPFSLCAASQKLASLSPFATSN